MRCRTCPECGDRMTRVLPAWCPVPGCWLCESCGNLEGRLADLPALVPAFGESFIFIPLEPGILGYIRGLWAWVRWLFTGRPA